MNQPIPVEWSRWTYASIAKHFTTKLNGTHCHVEGFERETDGKSEWFEIRVDGPFIDEQSKGHFKLEIEVNILCVTTEGPNAYRIHDLTGMAANAFTYAIPVYKFGAGGDSSLLGCYIQRVESKERVKTAFFGKIRPDTEIIQASVEGHYRMCLTV